jgi:hypothetical protein
MGFGRIGGMLVVGGCVLFMIAVAIAMGGGGVGIGLRDVGGLVLAASLALVGSGAAVLSVAGPWPLHGRVVRVGLGALAVGLVSLLVSSIVGAAASPGHEDQESLPMLVLLVVGLLATVLGPLITGLSLVRRPGPSRAVGSLLLAGMLLLVLTTLASPAVDQHLQEIAGALVVLGGTGVGVLAINGSRSAPVASR